MKTLKPVTKVESQMTRRRLLISMLAMSAGTLGVAGGALSAASQDRKTLVENAHKRPDIKNMRMPVGMHRWYEVCIKV